MGVNYLIAGLGLGIVFMAIANAVYLFSDMFALLFLPALVVLVAFTVHGANR